MFKSDIGIISPYGATHQEIDGTYWRCIDGKWYWWDQDWKKWRGYVGPINKCFLATRSVI